LALGGAVVYVCNQPAGYGQFPTILPAPLATIYQDSAGTIGLSSITLDGQGNGWYYAPIGSYTEVYTYHGYVCKVLPDQNIGTVAPGTVDVDLVLTAAQTITAGQVVSVHTDGNAYVASADNVLDDEHVVGIATSNGISGYTVTVRTSSEVDSSNFALTAGTQYFLGLTGELVTTPPSTGVFIQPMGTGLGATRLLLTIAQIGIQGIQGVAGVAGSQGVQGVAGAVGPQGAQGVAGAAGVAGVAGVAGAAGPQGIQGVAGSQGIQGIAGVAGAAGATGPAPSGLPNLVLATNPSGSSSAVSALRALVVADLPTLISLYDAAGAAATETARAEAAEVLLAPLASPHLTGAPLAPTATNGTNTTQIATTEFVTAAVAAGGGGGGGGGSGSGFPSGSNFVNLPPLTFAAYGAAGSSYILVVPAAAVSAFTTGFKLAISVKAISPMLNHAVVRRTAPGSMTWLDSTDITWGSVTNPTFSTLGLQMSDAITLAMDAAHDFYFIVYLDPAGSGQPYRNPNITYGNFNLAAGATSGDQTGTADATAFGAAGTPGSTLSGSLAIAQVVTI
jgi:hypothetical protein